MHTMRLGVSAPLAAMQTRTPARGMQTSTSSAPLKLAGSPFLGSRSGLAHAPALPRRSAGAKPLRVSASSWLDKYDAEKEERLKGFRVVYDFEKWSTHRGTGRYLRHMKGLFVSRILSGLALPLGVIATVATFVCSYETARAGGYLPEEFPSLAIQNPAVFNLSSFALSLLLVFRTNASYGRFDEARKLWGGVVNRSRDITRQAITYFQKEDTAGLEAFARYMAAYPWALKNHLREEKTWQKDLENILTPRELEALLESPHAPNTIMLMLGEIAWSASLLPEERLRIDENITFFADMCGACERLLRTPIPVSYTRHTSRFMVLWLFFAPFALYKSCGWLTLPSSVALAFVLLAIEEIGVQIEEAFYVLPLEAIATTIATNVKQQMEGREKVAELVSESYYGGRTGNASSGTGMWGSKRGPASSDAAPADSNGSSYNDNLEMLLQAQNRQ